MDEVKNNGWINVNTTPPPINVQLLVYAVCCSVCSQIDVAEYEGDGKWFGKNGEYLPFDVEYWKEVELPIL